MGVDCFASRSFWFFAILPLALLSSSIKFAAETEAHRSLAVDRCQVFTNAADGNACGVRHEAARCAVDHRRCE